jgi:hypothetical protein
MPLACSRSAKICVADKMLLLGLWDHAPYELRTHATGNQVFPSRRMLAEETGQTVDAVRDQLRRLAAAGWIRVEGDGWALAWMVPFEVPPATQTLGPATRTAGHEPPPGDSNPGPPATQTLGPATRTAGVGDSNRRPSKQENSNTPNEQTSAGQPALPGFIAEPAQAQPAPQRKTKGSKPSTEQATPAQIREWWSCVYLPIRKRLYDRWHPTNRVQPIECTDDRVKDIRDRLKASCGNQTPEQQIQSLTHVIERVEERVDSQRGITVPTRNGGEYNTMDNIAPAFWLRRTNFNEMLERPALVRKPASMGTPSGFPSLIERSVYEPYRPFDNSVAPDEQERS